MRSTTEIHEVFIDNDGSTKIEVTHHAPKDSDHPTRKEETMSLDELKKTLNSRHRDYEIRPSK